MSKSSKNIRGVLGTPLVGAIVVVVSITALIAALWVLMTLTRVVLG